VRGHRKAQVRVIHMARVTVTVRVTVIVMNIQIQSQDRFHRDGEGDMRCYGERRAEEGGYEK